ncbi:amidohydrolase [Longispora albida]|uniref:amidohydrolase n=1 Tax=Longispora albida TaxID=203523 RepID=UPI0003648C81|nr:amidohydrolase family protein [Longispora albida]
MDTTPTLYAAGRVYSPADPAATALLTEGGRITWLGPRAEAPAAARVVDLGGALVTPAFVDAHVHATDTGLALSGLDLTACESAEDVLDMVLAKAAHSTGVIMGHGWDLTDPPTAAELDAAAGGRPVYLTRIDKHSALVSPVLLKEAEGHTGHDENGWVKIEAHHAVRTAAYATMGLAERTGAQRLALRHAASLGIAAVHECGGPLISSEADFTSLLALEGDYPEVYGYWGELGGAAKARELGAAGAGGDLFADGAFGSRTACVRDPYTDGGCGHAYLTAEEVGAHLAECTRLGMQGGFHAIGDAAIKAVTGGFAIAAAQVGVEALREARHRVEHAEMLDKELIAAFVEYGIVASMQPAFDRLWGGEAGMYADRLGKQRALSLNPFAALKGVGVTLAFGSDSPVTPLDPWGGVHAAANHHHPVHRISRRAAFAAHTRGGWRAVKKDEEGVLVPGGPATFAAWDAPAGPDGLPGLEGGSPRCVRTVLRGRTIHEE